MNRLRTAAAILADYTIGTAIVMIYMLAAGRRTHLAREPLA